MRANGEMVSRWVSLCAVEIVKATLSMSLTSRTLKYVRVLEMLETVQLMRRDKI